MKWTVGQSRTLYDCPWFRLDLTDITLPGGQQIAHHVIRVPAPAVGILAVDADDRVLLLYRHRFITDRWGWEIPAGNAEPGEDAATAALRELEEETGVRCRATELLTRFATSNGLTDQEYYVYRATNPTRGNPATSTEESSQLRWVSRAEQQELLATGHIHDGPTMLALLLNPLTALSSRTDAPNEQAEGPQPRMSPPTSPSIWTSRRPGSTDGAARPS